MLQMTLFKTSLLILLASTISCVYGQPTANQTDQTSTVVQHQFTAFQVQIDLANFSLPTGLQSYARGIYQGQWLLVSGRTSGLHSFDIPGNNNFPPNAQNQTIYVVNPATGVVSSKSLTDPSSGLTQAQVDSLSVTASQFYTKDNMLYMTGGYGVDTATGLFSTKPILTAIDMPGLIHWVVNPTVGETAAEHIRQISNPIFQVTGGSMEQVDGYPTLLIFGQNFSGFYNPNTSGEYSKQIRRFHIHDDGINLSVSILSGKPSKCDPVYRRRDLNVVPAIFPDDGHNKPGYIAFSGVFTPDSGIWTVPVEISRYGKPTTFKPYKATTFKQGMNNYQCAFLSLFSKRHQAQHTVLFGGISYGFFQNGIFQVDDEIPFINQVTTITRDKYAYYTQYLMQNAYPVILSTQSNPGNQLLFGAGSHFLLADGVPTFSNGVVNLDKLGAAQLVIGYIVGGIQSTLSNTNVASDSAASPYVFKVTLIPMPN